MLKFEGKLRYHIENKVLVWWVCIFWKN